MNEYAAVYIGNGKQGPQTATGLAERLGAITSEFGAMDKALEKLTAICQSYQSKLTPITKPAGPIETKPGNRVVSLVPLADTLSAKTDIINNISELFEELYSRIEL